MPYIPKKERKELDTLVERAAPLLTSDGKINYFITKIICTTHPAISYSVLNRAIGVLECVKQEFYRRQIASYEDKKKQEEGDVY
jgi:hypothetical protein